MSWCVERAPDTALPEFVDPYLDPTTGLLRNRLNALTPDTLDQAEADLTEARTAELARRPVSVTADLTQLTSIHRRLFQDVYDWAGQLRIVDIHKGDEDSTQAFMPVSRLLHAAGLVFAELAEEKQLPGLSKSQFVDRLAHHYDQVNYLHPFREGNGRTQRLFWSQISESAGYVLDWRRTTGEVNDRASREAMEHQDFTQLKAMLDEVVQPVTTGRTSADEVETLRTVRLELPREVGRVPEQPKSRDVAR
jgi:cell filamentation protein